MASDSNSENALEEDLHLFAEGGLAGEPKDRGLVVALARGIEILRCFTPEESRLGNQEIAEKTGLPKPTVTRLTYTLVKLGCLKKSPISGKFHLHAGMLAFGHQTSLNYSAKTIARPYMLKLAEYTQTTVGMGVRDRLQMIYLDIIDGPTQFTLQRQVGSYLPLHLSAMGRACLAASSYAERELLLALIKERHAEDWDAIRSGLDRAFQDYEEHGYCTGDWSREINAVAVPFVHSEHGVLTFSCTAPSFQLSREKLEADVAPRLKQMVAQIQAATR